MEEDRVKFHRLGKTPLVKIDGRTYQFTTFHKNADGTVTFTARPFIQKEVGKVVDPILGQRNSD